MAFRPGLWPTVTVLLCLPVLVMLGTWQLDRLAWKTALIDALRTRQAEAPVALPASAALDPSWNHRRVVVRAALRAQPALRYGVVARGSEPGHLVLQAAELPDGRRLVVNRGWRSDRPADPLATPAGASDLIGVARWIDDVEPRPFTPANDPGGNRWYWYERGALETVFGHPVLPVVLEVTEGPGGPGAPVPQPVVVDLPNNHLGYALTWFGLALSLVVIYLVFGFTRKRTAA
jgi:surfeit locus 1 family protein